MRYKEASFAVTHRFPDPWRARGDYRRSAGCRLEIGDAPAFLRRRECERPRSPEERDLVTFADTPKKPCPCPEVKRCGEPLERRPLVASVASGIAASANARITRSTPLYRLMRPR